jgi:predicted alpha-1,2-mannosidase
MASSTHLPSSSASLVAVLALSLAAGCPAPEPEPLGDPLLDVDPLIGSGGGGWAQPQVFVGATTPFGLVRAGPDTTGYLGADSAGFAHTSGYWYLDDQIDGFSQLHLSGTGVEDLGNFLVTVVDGMTAAKTTESGYRQRFSHDTEEASPGRYAVTLEDTGVRAELTATPHAALHRYTLPADLAEPALLLDVGHGIGRPGALDGEVSITSDDTVEGWMDNAGRFTGEERAFRIYFSMTLDPAPASWGTWSAGALTPGADAASGADIGAWAELAAGTDEVVVRIGVSLIDVEQARTNRAQVDGRGYDEVLEETRSSWRALLDKAGVRGGAPMARRIFYSGLYHSAIMPTLMSEPSGGGGYRYTGVDREVRDDEGTRFYSDLSMWDTYRTAHPLFSLLWPEHANAFATSIVRMTEQHGSLPRWPLLVNETGTMLGSPATIVLSDTWQRGVRDFDIEQAIVDMKADADHVDGVTSRPTHAACVAAGYCPRDEVGRAVASAIEWGWADFALSELLHARGESDEAFHYSDRAKIPRGHFDPETGFYRGRTEAGFDPAEDFDAELLSDDYAEGNAWHYLYAAPYDVAGLVEGFGSKEAFLDKTRELFERAEVTPPKYLTDEFRQPDPYYWHGNEPDLHAAFTFSLLGEPAETARWVDWIRREKYDDTPWGLEGNDDGGTLSSWYALAAMGLFPLPGTDMWLLVPPSFDDITLQLATGDVRIVTERAAPTDGYIESVWLDGVEVMPAWLRHAELAGASELRFVLSATPTEFGRADAWVDSREGR